MFCHILTQVTSNAQCIDLITHNSARLYLNSERGVSHYYGTVSFLSWFEIHLSKFEIRLPSLKSDHMNQDYSLLWCAKNCISPSRQQSLSWTLKQSPAADVHPPHLLLVKFGPASSAGLSFLTSTHLGLIRALQLGLSRAATLHHTTS